MLFNLNVTDSKAIKLIIFIICAWLNIGVSLTCAMCTLFSTKQRQCICKPLKLTVLHSHTFGCDEHKEMKKRDTKQRVKQNIIKIAKKQKKKKNTHTRYWPYLEDFKSNKKKNHF